MSPALTRVTHAYSTTDAALIMCALDAAGFSVHVPGFHTISSVPHASVALGGLPVLVHTSQADDARAFLKALSTRPNYESDTYEITPDTQRPPRWSIWRVIAIIFYLSTGTAPALHGRGTGWVAVTYSLGSCDIAPDVLDIFQTIFWEDHS